MRHHLINTIKKTLIYELQSVGIPESWKQPKMKKRWLQAKGWHTVFDQSDQTI